MARRASTPECRGPITDHKRSECHESCQCAQCVASIVLCSAVSVWRRVDAAPRSAAGRRRAPERPSIAASTTSAPRARPTTARSPPRPAPASPHSPSPPPSATAHRSTTRWSPRDSRPSKASSSPTAASTATAASKTTKRASPSSCFAAANADGRYDEHARRTPTKFVRGLQIGADGDVNPSDPRYGGVGYGGPERPDLSNTSVPRRRARRRRRRARRRSDPARPGVRLPLPESRQPRQRHASSPST